MFSRAGWLEAVCSETSGAQAAYRAGAWGVLDLRSAIVGCLCQRMGAPGHDVNPSSWAVHCRDGLTITPEETV